MSEINFLDQNADKEEKKTREPDSPEDFTWTNPAGVQTPPATARPNPPPPVIKAPAPPKKSAALPDTLKPPAAALSNRSGIVALWDKLRGKSGRLKANSAGLGAKKEILAKSSEAIERENSLRQGGAAVAAEKKTVERKSMYVSQDDNQWRAPKVLKTNLMEGEVISFYNWRESARGFIAILLICGFLVGAAYVGLLFWEMRALDKSQILAVDIETVKQRIARAESNLDNINVFQKKLTLVGTLLKNHVYWTNFFKFIEAYTLPDVYYQGGFSGDTAGKYNFNATAGGYKDITDQLAAFKQSDKVLKAAVTSGSLTDSGAERGAGYAVGFQLELEIDRTVFHK